MESNFHSTVLQRPPSLHDYEDQQRQRERERDSERRHRDILNPVQLSDTATTTTTSTTTSTNPAPTASSPAPSPAPPGSSSHLQGPGQPPPPRHSFALRSPTQSDFHPPNGPHFPGSSSASPSTAPNNASNNTNTTTTAAANGTGTGTASVSGTRSLLHNPFLTSTTAPPSLPPPPIVPSAIAPPPRSPLHAPPVFYPQDMRDHRQSPREKTAGSFYDPTTDTTTTNTERKASDTAPSWHNPPHVSSSKPRDSLTRDYDYPSQPPVDHPPYYNGNYTSPVAANFPPRSPISHPHPAAGSISPSSGPRTMASPSVRQSIASAATASNSTPAPQHSPSGASVLKAPAPPTSVRVPSASPPFFPYMPADDHKSIQTPSRNVMSFSNILSSAEPDHKPRDPSPVRHVVEPAVKEEKMDTEPEKVERKKPARRPKQPRVSDIKNSESTPKGNSRRASAHKDKESLAAVRVPAKRTANGQPKQGGFSASKEKKIKELMDQMDVDTTAAENFDEDEELAAWRQRSQRRQRAMEGRENKYHSWRRANLTRGTTQYLTVHTDLAKRRFDDMYYDDALQEVREQEVQAEKERKKDMQRKRRREKSMAVTIEQKEAALAKAQAAELAGDEAERLKHLREAERANKKAQQTQLILQKGIKGPARNFPPVEVNLEGGIMSTFQANEVEPTGKGKAKGRSGPRPKKSKEQKQAEKENALAAQAALDAGEELPSKEETNKIRIKLKKDKTTREDSVKDLDAVEVPTPKEKEKVVEEPKDPLENKFQSKGFNQIYDQIWRDLARKDVNKVYRIASDSYQTKSSNLKKTAILASKEAKRWQLRTNKGTKDLQARAKRVMRDMMSFWKRNEREERDLRKAAEKQELENARKQEADREAARQKRKLNFLISQTELYSHFIGKKIKTHEVERSTDNPDLATEGTAPDPNTMDVDEGGGDGQSTTGKVTKFDNLTFEEEDEEKLQAIARANAQHALAEAQQKARDFNKEAELDEEGEMNFQNPTDRKTLRKFWDRKHNTYKKDASFHLPKLVWQEGGRLYKAGNDNEKAGFRNKYLDHMLNIWTPDNIRESLGAADNFSWLRFADTSPQEVYRASHQDVFSRAVELAERKDRLGYMNVVYDEPEDQNYTPPHALFQITRRNDRKPLADITEKGILSSLMNVASMSYDDAGFGRLEQAGRPNTSAPPIDVSCNSRGAKIEREDTLFNVPMRRALYEPTPGEQKAFITEKVPLERIPVAGLLPPPDNEKKRATENRNKDIAMWLADDDDAVEKMIEQREQQLIASGELEKKKKGGRKKKNESVSLDDMYHEGEGHFDDNKQPGTATPLEEAPSGSKKKGKSSKKAKTTKQRLAIADGMVD
ncbi:hypothetical protein VSDG_09171 [Cytospora chrysosperma]|uniref:Chromatin-remodeling ATPase INO80 n=1 Tax=Cytospora chrysosperma TaxID=252740 RepID=A0A423VAW3_CYTCH|nr:hypothetical protein VSDG_09171 [Valsa sordida]